MREGEERQGESRREISIGEDFDNIGVKGGGRVVVGWLWCGGERKKCGWRCRRARA